MKWHSCAVPVSSCHYLSLFCCFCYTAAHLGASPHPRPLHRTMVPIQAFMQEYWRPWSGSACGGAAGEQQPDYARVSVVPFLVGRQERVRRHIVLFLYFHVFLLPFGALPKRLCFWSTSRGWKKYSSMRRQSCAVPVFSRH